MFATMHNNFGGFQCGKELVIREFSNHMWKQVTETFKEENHQLSKDFREQVESEATTKHNQTI